MDVFYRERQLCELFKSENNGFDVTFNINSSEVSIFVHHSGNWNIQKGKKKFIGKRWSMNSKNITANMSQKLRNEPVKFNKKIRM